MRRLFISAALSGFVAAFPLRSPAAPETVRLNATADVWLSGASESECNSSAGRCDRIKIKSIQEMAAIRFDAAPARGREVRKANLFLRRAGPDMLRYIRASTVNQNWAAIGRSSTQATPILNHPCCAQMRAQSPTNRG